MFSKLLFRLSTVTRPSGQDESSMRVEVCPPADTSVSRPAGLASRLASHWRATAASLSRDEGASEHAADRAAHQAELESTQAPDADTRLCPRVCESAASAQRVRASNRTDRDLAQARADMMRSMSDLRDPNLAELRVRVQAAASLRDLWHLRLDVFNLIAIERDQREADRRLSTINRHFPLRLPRGHAGAAASNSAPLNR